MAKLERDVERIGNLPYALPRNIEKIPTLCNFGNTRQGRGENENRIINGEDEY